VSYILEALKRAEEQRGASPRAVPTPRALPPVSRARWPWIAGGLAGAAAVVAAVALWTTLPSAPSTSMPPVASSPPPPADVAPPPRVEPAPRLEPAPRVEPAPPPAPGPARQSSPSEASRPRAPGGTRATQARPPATTERGAAGSVASPPAVFPALRRDEAAAPTTAADTARATPPRAPVPASAPPAAPAGEIRALAAKLSLQVLSWAPDPKDRFVFVSGRKYREGQTIDDKLLVERITEDSVVLSFQGERFTLRGP
jgi:hypothetical protein